MAKTSIYVPDKSELALATHKPHLRLELLDAIEAHEDVELATDASSANLIAFFESWSTQQPSYVHTVKRDPFFRAHWKKLYTINDDDIVPGLLPGIYTSLERHTFDPTIHRACAYPRAYNDEIEKLQDPVKPEVLATLRGTRGSSPLRDRLADALEGAENVWSVFIALVQPLERIVFRLVGDDRGLEIGKGLSKATVVCKLHDFTAIIDRHHNRYGRFHFNPLVLCHPVDSRTRRIGQGDTYEQD